MQKSLDSQGLDRADADNLPSFLTGDENFMFEDFRLKVFMELVSRKSFTAAARALGVSQPAVSQHISELERILGVQLFERSRSEVRLTEAGEKLKGYAVQILYWYDCARRDFNGEPCKSSAILPMGDGASAEVSVSEGNIHISIVNTKNL